jgi:hypothetical protein
MAAREAFMDGGGRGAGRRRCLAAVAELVVGHGDAIWWLQESAHFSAMAARDGGPRARREVAAAGALLWRRWGPEEVLLRWWPARGRRGGLNQERRAAEEGERDERDTSEGGEWHAETVRARDP